jgi:hypothetical protein
MERETGPETVSLGRFDPLKLPIILEALRERGIFAMTKTPLEKADNDAYKLFGESREVLLVDRAREQEARRVIETEVRDQISEMSSALGTEPDVDFEAQGLVPIGWLEPEVARELLTVLRDAGIPAAAEYPLDEPPPQFARTDGRVRVHVEEVSLALAEELLETEVVDALMDRGVAMASPVIGEDQ